MDLKIMGAYAADAGRNFVARCRGYLVWAAPFAEKLRSKMIPFLLSPLGRYAAIFAVGLAAWFGWIHNHDKKVSSRVVAKIEERNNANVQKAEAARRAVDSVPAGSLRDAYRRD